MEILKEKYREFRLPNGLFVALQKTPTKTVFGRLRVNQGAVHERRGEEGLTHFLEHCLARAGTEKYSPEEVEKMGEDVHQSNATTMISRTEFYGDVNSEELWKFLDLGSQIAFHPRFDREKVEEERQRVLREIELSRSKPGYTDQMWFVSNIFRGHPLFREHQSEYGNVKKADIRDLKRVHQRGFNASNSQLILVGDLPKDIEKMVKEYFGREESGRQTPYEFPELKPIKKRKIRHIYSPQIVNKDNPGEHGAIIDFGFVTPPDPERESFALTMAGPIIYGGANSRLDYRISRERGLSYYIHFARNTENNAGYAHIGMTVPSNRQEEALDLMFDEFRRFKEKGPTKEEFERVKKGVKYIRAKGIETNEGHVSAIGYRLQYGLSPEEVFRRLDSVTLDEIHEVAQKYFPGSRKDNNYVLMIQDSVKKK